MGGNRCRASRHRGGVPGFERQRAAAALTWQVPPLPVDSAMTVTQATWVVLVMGLWARGIVGPVPGDDGPTVSADDRQAGPVCRMIIGGPEFDDRLSE